MCANLSEIGAPSNTNLNTNTNALLTSWTCCFMRLCSVSWPKCFTSLYAFTDDYKLRWLQLRILYRIVPANERSTIPIWHSANGQLCPLFWCARVPTAPVLAMPSSIALLGSTHTNSQFRNAINRAMLRSKLGRSCAPEKQIYVCILLGKWYIWRCRFNKTKPNIQGFICMGIDYIRVERYAAMVTDSTDKFNCNWFQLNEILKNSQHPP